MADYPFLYLNPSLRSGGVGSDPRLRELSGRQSLNLRVPSKQDIRDPELELKRSGLQGVVIGMGSGLPTLDQLRVAEHVLGRRMKVWFHWPGESSIEGIDREAIRSYTRHFMMAEAWNCVRPAAQLAHNAAVKLLQVGSSHLDSQVADRCNIELESIIQSASPVLVKVPMQPKIGNTLPGPGVYLRTDFWSHLSSGGSYGHTCYLARSLARTVDSLICLTPSHYTLLSELGLEQAVIPSPGANAGERDLLLANSHYYPLLSAAVAALKPSFIYERLCLGNYCGARLSREFGIPYIVEYNGSEIDMSRTFSGHRFQHEALFVKAEQAAFRQATAISVISEVVRDDLISRGIPADKILVNPNGVDAEVYAPADNSERLAIRAELGFEDSDCIVGFSGTFGGWHGIDVLAQAIPELCRRVPQIRFLLIGDGNYKHLVNSAVTNHGLHDRVVSCGRVPQQEGARLLRSCDIYVSPHSRVMSSGRFLGSPTKLFEYMAMSRGIVASDLDQIGEVLAPSLRARDLNGRKMAVSEERAVLCRPGDVAEFVSAVEYLAHHPEVANSLGQNARNAALGSYTWDRHIERLWDFIGKLSKRQGTTPLAALPNGKGIIPDPLGPQKLRQSWGSAAFAPSSVQGEPHSLEWYLEMEESRYGKDLPWLSQYVPFGAYANKKVLEIGSGIGMDLIQFAKRGAEVTYLCSSSGNLALAEENFQLRGLPARFVRHREFPLDIESETFDLVYCAEFSYQRHPDRLAGEIWRVLKPGGQLLAIALAENSGHHWFRQFLMMGLVTGLLSQFSMSEIVSRDGEMAGNRGQPIQLYTPGRLEGLLSAFRTLRVSQRPLAKVRHSGLLGLPIDVLERLLPRTMIIEAFKSRERQGR